MSLLFRSSRLAVLALAVASGAHAAELGEASVRSYSGQPLAADIELTELSTQELADLQVRLARPEVFQGANVKMNPALAGASLTVQRRDGRRVLHVTTSAPVQAEVLHLYFQLASGGKERVRSVTLWLSPDPNPAPAPVPAPAAMAAAPAAARADKPVARRTERPAQLVAMPSPGKEATPAERELLGALGRALAVRGGKVEEIEEKKGKPVSSKPLSQQEIRKEALKHASTAQDFHRAGKPAKPVVAEHEPPIKEEAEEKKAPQRSFLASKAELAEAARATRASVEGPAAPKVAKAAEPAAPAKPAVPARPAGDADPAMLDKLAELEGKLKTLQAQLAMTNTAGAARVPVLDAAKGAAPASVRAHTPGTPTAAAAPAQMPNANTIAAVPAKTPDATTVAAAAASAAQPPAPAQAGPIAAPAGAVRPESAMPEPVAQEAKAAPPEEPKAEPGKNKEAAPPPPEPKKEIKISRPKLLTFLFAGSLVLLVVFGVIVHFVRKAKMKRSPIVRQSWSRDDNDAPARVEPAIAAPAEESKAA